MKKYITGFKNSIQYAVSIIASREFAFIYCTIGTIAQVSHTYFLINNISSLDGGWRTAQALMLSIFISSSLLYFTAISDNGDSKESKRVHFAVTLFTVIEILINIYYYSRHLIIDNLNNITIKFAFDFVFAVVISCLIPVTIKLYSSHIRAKEWLMEDEKPVISEQITQVVEYDDSAINTRLDELINRIEAIPTQQESDIDIEAFKQELIDIKEQSKSEIYDSFRDNSKLFFEQFEAKIENYMKKKANTI